MWGQNKDCCIFKTATAPLTHSIKYQNILVGSEPGMCPSQTICLPVVFCYNLDKILKEDHQRIILAKLESNWPSSLRGKQLKFHPPFLFLATVAMLVGSRDCRTQF